MTLLRLALGNLRCRRARSELTVSAIALGIAAVVALTGIAWGFEASWQKANDARGTDLIVTRTATESSMPSPFRAERIRDTLAGYPHVAQVVGLLSEMLSVGEGSPPVFVFGWAHRSYLWDHLRLVDGRWPQDDTEPAALVGTLAAELLHKTTGGTLEIEGQVFPIVGVFESSAVVENGAVLITLSQAQQVLDKPGKVNVLNLKLDDSATPADLDAIRSRVLKELPGFVAITSGELVAKNAMVRISKAMSDATILIAGMVGALVVFNTMLMSVAERTREIGILLAVGWQRRTVMRLVLAESTLLSLAGGLIGSLLGVAIATGLAHMDLMRGKIDPLFSAPFLAAALALALLLGIAGGLWPALKAARLRPAQALWHE